MAKENETIEDIIAEKRRRADEIERDCAEKMKSGEMISDCYARELIADIRKEADRIEVANKRERGDCAKLREAAEKTRATLEEALQILNGISDEEAGTLNARLEDVADEICEVTQWIIPDALAAPPRNCDVGTAEEQEDGFRRYCNSRGTFCGDCPLYNNRRGECRFAWAQLPYEKGEAK